jgi:hypothetical protein
MTMSLIAMSALNTMKQGALGQKHSSYTNKSVNVLYVPTD